MKKAPNKRRKGKGICVSLESFRIGYVLRDAMQVSSFLCRPLLNHGVTEVNQTPSKLSKREDQEALTLTSFLLGK